MSRVSDSAGGTNQATARVFAGSSRSTAQRETGMDHHKARQRQDRPSQSQRGSGKRESSTLRETRDPFKKQKTVSMSASATGAAALPARTGTASDTNSGAVSALRTLSEVRTYNLRATTARKQAHQHEQTAATVTPAAARQINFERNEEDERRDTVVLSEVAAAVTAVVPAGVVDVFDERQPVLNLPACKCPFDRSMQLDTALLFVHLAHYGKEQLESLREREMGHWDQLSDYFTPQVLREALASPSSVSRGDDASSSSGRGDISSPESGVISNASTTSPDTPLRGAIRRFCLRSRPSRSHMVADLHGTAGPNVDTTEPLPRQPFLTARMRGILVNWLVEVSLEYKMSDRTIHLAVSILDFILWLGPTKSDFDPDEEGVFDPDFLLIQRTDFQALGWYVDTCSCSAPLVDM